jgi:hypothetical protein
MKFYYYLDYTRFWEIFASFKNSQILWRKSTKFVHEFCGLDSLGILALVKTATLGCFNDGFLRIFTLAPCPFNRAYLSRNFFMNPCQDIFKQLPHTFTWLPSPLIIVMETQATTHCCLEPFRWESPWRWDLGHNMLLFQTFLVGIPLTMGFRPQLVVVSGLFGGNPFDDGI